MGRAGSSTCSIHATWMKRGEEGEIDADMSDFRLLSSESDYTLSSDPVQDGSMIIGKWGADSQNGGGGWFVGKVRPTANKWKKDMAKAKQKGREGPCDPRVVFWDDGYETIWDCAEPITRETFNEEMSAKTEAESRAPVFSWFVAEDVAADAQSEDEMDVSCITLAD